MERKWKRPLTNDEMCGVLDGIAAADTPMEGLVTAMVGVYSVAIKELLGISWQEFMADDSLKLVPWEYAIPQAQWGEIATAITNRQKQVDPLSATNLLLDWMNKGPGAYEP
jgi:hypothetical protein